MKTPQNMTGWISTLFLGLLSMVCNVSAQDSPRNIEIPADVSRIPDTLKYQPSFICTFEKDRILERDPDVHNLFLHAIRLYKKNILGGEHRETARLYRIAAAWGHGRAAFNLANLLIDDYELAKESLVMPVEVAEDLIRRGMPNGYLLMSRLLEMGHDDVKKDIKTSLKFLRKAADLGDPEAQARMGGKLYKLSLRYPFLEKIGIEMKRCAADQGHMQAAYDIATIFQQKKKYDDAVKYLQIAVKAKGNREGYYVLSSISAESNAASALNDAFRNPAPDDMWYLGLAEDQERAERYNKIYEIFSGDDYPVLSEDIIDQIVPLPPAKLSAWDGKIETVPPLPDEERIMEMAYGKGLDPNTGNPLKRISSK